MNLIMALVIVLLIFFSSTFAIPQLEGDAVQQIIDDVDKKQINFDDLFLDILLSEHEEAINDIGQYEYSPLNAITFVAQQFRDNGSLE